MEEDIAIKKEVREFKRLSVEYFKGEISKEKFIEGIKDMRKSVLIANVAALVEILKEKTKKEL